ncbi:glycosyltransferase family 2 protein [Noviherbaspirillum pedocola]|uniref:Glycosyltransferase family 2 protein n=1 Tax=Noviherbaspirillum pedocola TaxID=2801341 RepID=A0A934SPM8_9BURK|nr:glycosyltransferase family 2 protein [Noviherbaspirillum pedocola]MBK4734295.1 glycosyltransferase family 2 protein [Noviherbaspirillum pedocola]
MKTRPNKSIGDGIPSKNHQRVLCIVLSFNGYDDTAECLRSLEHNRPEEMDILVVDNASAKGTTEQLRLNFPKIELVALDENLGWAGGNNVGIRIGLSRGYDWICLLNNDIVFPELMAKNWFAALTSLAPCLVHPSIYYWDEPMVPQLHPGVDGGTYAFGAVDGGVSRFVMDYAYGACLGIHRTIFESVGLLDERFFLQLEETDFHTRSKQFGFQSVCESGVKIFHKESRAFGGRRTPMKTYYATRNTLLLIGKKQGGSATLLRGLKSLYWTTSNIARSVSNQEITRLGFLRWLISSDLNAKAVRFGVRDFLLCRFGRASNEVADQLKL